MKIQMEYQINDLLMPFVLRVAIKYNLNHELDDVYKELNVFGT